MARVNRKPIAPELLESMVESRQVVIESATAPPVKEVAKLVARSYRITLTDLRGPSRLPGLVRPRHVAIWLAHKLCGISNEKICNFFGRRDPATIRHAIRQIEQRRAGDFVLEEQLGTLISQLTRKHASQR
jgi:chromosomal replication initiator protein